MKKIWFLIFLLFFTTTLWAETYIVIYQKDIPFEQGLWKKHKVTYSGDIEGTEEGMSAILGTKEINGKVYSIVNKGIWDENKYYFDEVFYYQNNFDGLFRYNEEFGEFQEYKYPLKLGQEWKVSETTSDKLILKTTAKVSTKEYITVFGKNYMTLKITYSYYTRENNEDYWEQVPQYFFEYTEWVAKEIGKVKSILKTIDRTTQYELEEYYIPSKTDSDGDGIMDNVDLCQNTPINTKVDETGCYVFYDTDNDSIPDELDTCPNTPESETVTVSGCSESQLDNDRDGVMNNVDLCPNTTINTQVDETGCYVFYDTDNDSIPDEFDICPNTPEGETTVFAGCSESQLDDDGDGINNVLDACENTPNGTDVGNNGCKKVPTLNQWGIIFLLCGISLVGTIKMGRLG